MRMLGFMIALTLIYWVMASYSQSILTGGGDCMNAIALSGKIEAESRISELSASSQTAFRGTGAARDMQFENRRAVEMCR